MNAVWDVEVSIIRGIQALGRWLEQPMLAVSALGSEMLFLALLPLLFWCVHAGFGARIGVALLGTSVINGLLKSLAYGARPYWFDSSVTPMSTENTFGVPSGHTQTATVGWGYAAARISWRWSWPVAGAAIGLTAFSRVYLGVHFLSDVLVGLAVGLGLLWGMLRYEGTVLRWWRQRSLTVQLGMAGGVSLLPLALAASWQAVRGGWEPPEGWGGSVPGTVPGASVEHLVTTGGAFFGVLAGLSVLAVRGWYSASGPVVSRVTRYVFGVTGLVLIMVVLRLALPGGNGAVGAVGDYVGYALIGAWTALGAPELFVRMGLAQRPGTQEAQEAGV
ncbi:PAP2 superfamily protein [Haloactinospora alba]|uniref:PAP2 superfamily protein n=1 Tax=Haloactinospora alba TaxID=405555 RepID=A0A543NHN5_9ACTN|nr:phosphatase PAP2 family protein [Haloactinospora alba]TQN31319.1 PAP2 superfamily protein [Haloactinospora alba]